MHKHQSTIPTSDLISHVIHELTDLSRYYIVDEKNAGIVIAQKIKEVTKNNARLVLRQWKDSYNALARSAETIIKYPVIYREITYGTLFIRAKANESNEPSLLLHDCQEIASLCGWLLHLHEHNTIIENLGRSIARGYVSIKLTPSVRRVLILLGEGLDEGEIAHHLNISKLTVRKHKQTLYETLNVRSSFDLILAAHYAGLFLWCSSDDLVALDDDYYLWK